MRRALGIGSAVGVAVAALAATGGMAASRNGDRAMETAVETAVETVRRATRRYRDVGRATDEGYVQFFGCVHEPLAGSMGIHFVNGTLADDTALDAARPEALMYEQRPNGSLELIGVEYVVFKDAWDAEHAEPPALFGEPFDVVEAPNRYGIPSFYELHVWAWRENPVGAHEDWNPKVLCPGAEGHAH